MRPSKEKQHDYNTDNNWSGRYFRNSFDRDSNHLNDGNWRSERGDFIREKPIFAPTPYQGFAAESLCDIRIRLLRSEKQ